MEIEGATLKLALVVLNYNDADNTLKLLEDVSDFTVFDKIIIVDNDSNDDSKVRLRHFVNGSGDMLLVENTENKGYGAGNNLGVFTAGSMGMDLALIANPDTEFDERTVRALKAAMHKNPEIGILAPLMEVCGRNNVCGSAANVIEGASCWPARDFWHSLAENGPVCRRIFRRALHYNENFYNAKIRSVGAVAGALLMVRVSGFIDVGGYDEGMFLYGEEDVISMKMAEAGYASAVITGYRYRHINSASIKKSLKNLYQRQKIRERSMLYFYKKYMGIGFLKELIAGAFFCAVRLEVLLSGMTDRRRI